MLDPIYVNQLTVYVENRTSYRVDVPRNLLETL